MRSKFGGSFIEERPEGVNEVSINYPEAKDGVSHTGIIPLGSWKCTVQKYRPNENEFTPP